MQNKYMENKINLSSIYGGGYTHSAISRKVRNSCEAMYVEDMYPPIMKKDVDAYAAAIERDQESIRAKAVKEFLSHSGSPLTH